MSDKNKTYCLINYGCQMNESDTEHYAGQLQELGYAPNPDFHTADIIIVNTCCVRESAEKKIAGKIGELKAVKRANPDVVICVAGCMAQKDGEKLRKKHPQVDLLLGTAYVNDFKRLLLEFLAERKAAVYTDLTIHQSEFEGHMVRQSSFAAWIPIMYGCNNFCTYCIVPYVRGRERSRSSDIIISEARELVKSGYKEITLLGQNVNSYGNDREGEMNFASLLREINNIDGDFIIRFMTSHPKDCTHELLDTMAQCEKVAKHLHLPVQCGNDRVLKAMNRGYTAEKYLSLLEYARSVMPELSVTSDIIVGFPGETYEEFLDTVKLIEKAQYTSLYTFIFSPREGTRAAKMDDPVSREEKGKWFSELCAAQEKIAAARTSAMVGREYRVLCESKAKKDGYISGRTQGQYNNRVSGGRVGYRLVQNRQSDRSSDMDAQRRTRRLIMLYLRFADNDIR